MTLSTDIYILDPVDPKEVFDFCNKYLLKVTDPLIDHKPDTTWSRDTGWVDDPEVMDLSNRIGQGFDAWLLTKYRKNGPLYSEDQYDDDEDREEPYLLSPACFMKLDFDTAYGYRSEFGGCAQLHSRYIVALHDWLETKGVRIKWRNEFTGEIFDGLDGLDGFGNDGDAARDWFKSILPGVLTRALEESKIKKE